MPTRADANVVDGVQAVRRYAFGLEVVSRRPFVGSASVHRNGGGAPTIVEVADPSALDRAWSGDGAVSLWEQRQPSGRLFMEIERHPERGYRISAPGYGLYVISPDGRRVLAFVPPKCGWRWQRLFFAQVLPVAAALRGFAIFHASAVAIGGHGYGFVAASGTGKTSVATHLVAGGAAFVTDDVLAIEAGPEQVRAHPGSGMLAVDPSELARLTGRKRAALGRVMGRAGKTYLAVDTVGRSVPLSGLYYLRRGSFAESFSIAPRAPDPSLLLSSAFLTYLATPEHLRGHLEACARIGASVPLYELNVPPGVPSSEVAERVAAHVAADRPEGSG